MMISLYVYFKLEAFLHYGVTAIELCRSEIIMRNDTTGKYALYKFIAKRLHLLHLPVGFEESDALRYKKYKIIA